MTISLLTTKLRMPVRQSRWVPRPHLLQHLDAELHSGDGFARKLTLVSAPAGYGKTMLIPSAFNLDKIKPIYANCSPVYSSRSVNSI